MLVIGIAGGIASGKSLVASQFQRLGAEILDADRAGHQVLCEPNVKQMLRDHFGDEVFADGQIDRQRLAAIVFQDSDLGRGQLRKLEQITHPGIRDLLEDQLDKLKEDGLVPAAVLDAPVMFKAGWDKLCDKIVFVEVGEATRQQRAQETRNWSSGELAARESRQQSLREKKERATDIIDNSSTIEHLVSQVDQLWKKWELPFPKLDNQPT